MRRFRLPGAIAEALERQHGDRVDQRAALARHYVDSAALIREHLTEMEYLDRASELFSRSRPRSATATG